MPRLWAGGVTPTAEQAREALAQMSRYMRSDEEDATQQVMTAKGMSDALAALDAALGEKP